MVTSWLPWGLGHWIIFLKLPHALRHSVSHLPRHAANFSARIWKSNSCGTLPQCLGPMGSGPHNIHLRITLGHQTVILQLYTTSWPLGVGQGASLSCSLPHHVGALPLPQKVASLIWDSGY